MDPKKVIHMPVAPEDENKTAKQIIEAIEQDGHLIINIKDIDFDHLANACEWLFSQTDDVKAEITRKPYNPYSKHIYKGMIPINCNGPNVKEQFIFGKTYDISQDARITQDNWMYEQSAWPQEDGKFPFKYFMMNYHETLNQLALTVLKLICKGIDIPENAFNCTFGDLNLSTTHLLKYHTWAESGSKPPSNAISEEGQIFNIKAHTDTTFLTLLHTFDDNGLEILDNTGKWNLVSSGQNGLIMTIGDTFSRMVNGRFKPTIHRVIDVNKTRISVPFFLEPHFYADISEYWIAKWTGNQEKHVYEAYGPWAIHMMKNIKRIPESGDWPGFDYNI